MNDLQETRPTHHQSRNFVMPLWHDFMMTSSPFHLALNYYNYVNEHFITSFHVFLYFTVNMTFFKTITN